MAKMNLRLMAVAGALLALGAGAWADDYPSKPVRIIIPFAPGGINDVAGRVVATHLTQRLGKQVVPENKAGAGGVVGTEIAAKSAADGYTITVVSIANALQPALYKLTFDPHKAFDAVAMFVTSPNTLAINPDVPAKNLQEFIAYAKSKPGELHYASGGTGGSLHLGMELFKLVTKTDLVHVPFRGTGPSMTALIGGHIQMMFDLLPVSLPQIAGGKVRALANAGATRASALKDLPTVAEQGLTGFDSSSWIALVAPAKTPAPVLAKLRAEVAKVIAAPDIVKRLHELGSEPGTADEKEARAFLAAETRKWAEVIRLSGAKVE